MRMLSRVAWLRWREFALLLAAAVVVSGIWGFIELADEVSEGGTQEFDEWAVRAMRRADDPATPVGPPWLAEVGRDLTALGGIAVLVLMTVFACGYLALQRSYHAMWLLAAAASGGLMLSLGLKELFARDRPDLVPHLSHVVTSSFPSGHSMMASAVYLTLGALLSRTAAGRGTKIYFLHMALLLTTLVGVSRVFLGVHYPTDVLAGWAAGAAWAMVCWLVAVYLQSRGKVEQPPETSE